MFDLTSFYVGALPRIAFGADRIRELPAFIHEYGRRVLLVTGGKSFRRTSRWPELLEGLRQLDIEWVEMSVEDEPSPQKVDEAVARYHPLSVDVVVGIGGGSVVDAAKAIAGLLPSGNSVFEYLEDVGKGMPYAGPALPFIAVPTTAGTGSEATKNAVLSQRGVEGFKKSFRHETLVARVALVDPELLAGCPPALIAAQGMDALTQLLESFVSLRANPFTDALARSGLQAVGRGFFAAWEGGQGETAREGRAMMAYAALLSGITLAQVGLGSVHGLAQPLGSLFPVPHGVACGTTVAAATQVNLQALTAREPDSPALAKYAEAATLLGIKRGASGQALVRLLEAWRERMALPGLGHYGVTAADIPRIVAASRNNSMKTNPVPLTDAEVAEIVRSRL